MKYSIVTGVEQCRVKPLSPQDGIFLGRPAVSALVILDGRLDGPIIFVWKATIHCS